MSDTLKGTGVNSVCCSPESPGYCVLTPEEKQRFGLIVNQLRKQGMCLELAQEMAFSRVMSEDISFTV